MVFDVAADEEIRDTPSATREIATNVSGVADTMGKKSGTPELDQTVLMTAIVPGSAEENAMWKAKFDNKQRMIRKIAAS